MCWPGWITSPSLPGKTLRQLSETIKRVQVGGFAILVQGVVVEFNLFNSLDGGLTQVAEGRVKCNNYVLKFMVDILEILIKNTLSAITLQLCIDKTENVASEN